MKKTLAVTSYLLFHFVMLQLLSMKFGVRSTEYLLWMILVEVTMMNYESRN